MRGFALMEGPSDAVLPMPLAATIRRTYRRLLGGVLPVQVAEIVVARTPV